MCEHGCVTEQFMKNIWLWGVEGRGMMTHVLCRAEDSEAEGVEEFPLRQEPTDRL